MSKGSVAKDRWWQVVGSQQDSTDRVSKRLERSNGHAMGREEDSEDVPGRRNSTGKGMGQTVAFSST